MIHFTAILKSKSHFRYLQRLKGISNNIDFNVRFNLFKISTRLKLISFPQENVLPFNGFC